jgi:hypothetical protein
MLRRRVTMLLVMRKGRASDGWMDFRTVRASAQKVAAIGPFHSGRCDSLAVVMLQAHIDNALVE